MIGVCLHAGGLPQAVLRLLCCRYKQDLVWNASKPECKIELQALLNNALGLQLPGHANLSHR